MKIETVYKINEMIRELYDTDLSVFKRVNNFFHSIYEMIYYDRCSIMFYKKAENGWEKHSSIALNWEGLPTPMTRYAEYYINIDDTLPILAQDRPVVFRCTQIFNWEKRKETEYYKGFVVPNGCTYSIEANLDIQSSMQLKCAFYLFREADKVDFTEQEEEIIRLFQPHLSQILRHYGETRNTGDILFMLENYNCVASVLLDGNYNIIRSDGTFKAMQTKTGTFLNEKIVSGCMAMNKNASLGNEESCSFEIKVDETPYYMEITRVREVGSNAKGNYLCLIFDMSRFFNQAIAKVKNQYMLTEREFNVFGYVIKGMSAEEIAKQMYISVPTVKKYLSSIYSKLEIKNQKQILGKLDLT